MKKQINDTDPKKLKKEVFKVRSKTAAYIVCFYVLAISFAIIADLNWTILPISVEFTFAILLLCLILSVGVFACIEMNNLFYQKNKYSLSFLIISFLAFQCGIFILYLLKMYGLSGAQATEWFAGLIYVFLFIGVLVIAIISWIIAYSMPCTNRHKNSKYAFLMSIIINLFFFSLMYLFIARTWTTVVLIFLLSNLSDVFAYIGGSTFGKHKMCPKISPKKTWEGAIFSLVVTTAVCLFVYGMFSFGNEKFETSYLFLGVQFASVEQLSGSINSWWWYFIIAIIFIVLIIVSMSGDLFFSWIKRTFKIKDFSNFLPGHGGILDRIDALSFIFIFYTVICLITNIIFNSSTVFFLEVL